MKTVAFVSFLLLALGVSAQQAPSVPLGAGRPETPGVTRTPIRDDAKSSVVRVHFIPGAKEPPHTHPYDIILVPVTAGTVDLNVAGKAVTTFKVGDVQFIPRDTTHYLANVGREPLEFLAIGVK